MRILTKNEIQLCFELEPTIKAIEQAFIDSSNGTIFMPPVQNFNFAAVNGDCCIKSAYVDKQEMFLIKVSTGFYNNIQYGLPNNNGLMMLLSALTGEPLFILQDEGWLTSIRTAIAGLIVAKLLAPKNIENIGLIGTGEQALLQLELLLTHTTCRTIWAYVRTNNHIENFIQKVHSLGCTLNLTESPELVASHCNFIITATPSRQPLLMHEWIKAGTHITAIGADAPNKQELDPAILKNADFVIVDSLLQCSAYGELSHLPEQTDLNSLFELGHILQKTQRLRDHNTNISIADLTGIAAQDYAIAKTIVSKLWAPEVSLK